MSRMLLLCTTALVLAAPAHLHAQPGARALPALPQGAEPRIGRYVELVVDDHGNDVAAGLFNLPFHPSVHTVVLFPDDIERARGFPEPDFSSTSAGTGPRCSPPGRASTRTCGAT